MAVYTKTLARGILPTFGPTVVYTVPVGKAVVVLDVCLCQFVAGSAALLALLHTPGTAAVTFASSPNVSAYNSYHWDGRQAMQAGDELEVQANVNGMAYAVTGYEFDAA